MGHSVAGNAVVKTLKVLFNIIQQNPLLNQAINYLNLFYRSGAKAGRIYILQFTVYNLESRI
jgi:hypothetical protein